MFQIPELFVSDMDATMIQNECIDELAKYGNVFGQVTEITEKAMNGDIDFETSLRSRVKLLRGIQLKVVNDCLRETIKITDGAKELITFLKKNNTHTVLVTGGFFSFADPIGLEIGFDEIYANTLEIINGELTGNVVGGIVDAKAKRDILLNFRKKITMAIGDGANDILMIKAATYGIAFGDKEALVKEAKFNIRNNLFELINMF